MGPGKVELFILYYLSLKILAPDLLFIYDAATDSTTVDPNSLPGPYRSTLTINTSVGVNSGDFNPLYSHREQQLRGGDVVRRRSCRRHRQS